ncbi:hypothetical protein MMF93_28245 [Streptomyces tubbatahanensis]|uniref:Alkaline shock response membrane anchor protein AmaP n=1 Tax=Streptomyces tubbatahanensis TaxID=2923272 RepID=A0ABY3XZD2_9ACTN|nr:hypothetical protein [Streptomyces tubbatahanensis]UNS99915.1 hypothetical protein MMF93_28245 [Streptomyces tubbatahanensis]
MSSPRKAANRTLLLLTGVALLAGGVWLLSTSSWVADRVGHHLPSWWPTAEPGSVLLDRPGLNELRERAWWTPVVVAGTALLLVVLLLGLLAQTRRGGLRVLPLSHPEVTVRTHALADALTREVRALPSVAGAHVRVRARARELRAHIHLRLEPGARPETVLRQLFDEPLAQARSTAAPRPVRAEVRISVRSHRSQRAA